MCENIAITIDSTDHLESRDTHSMSSSITFITEEQICCICQEPLCIDQQVLKLACDHSFHDECLLTWLNIEKACPLCKKSLSGLTRCWAWFKRAYESVFICRTNDSTKTTRSNIMRQVCDLKLSLFLVLILMGFIYLKYELKYF